MDNNFFLFQAILMNYDMKKNMKHKSIYVPIILERVNNDNLLKQKHCFQNYV